jgi:hypothetical protein
MVLGVVEDGKEVAIETERRTRTMNSIVLIASANCEALYVPTLCSTAVVTVVLCISVVIQCWI